MMKQYEQHLEKARGLFGEKKYEQAAAEYIKSLSGMPDDKQRAIAWAELCWLFYKQNKNEKCLEAADNALKYDPDYEGRADLFRLMGFCNMALQQDNLAEKYLLQSLEQDRSSEGQQYAIFELARLYFTQQKYTPAENLFREVDSWFYQNHKEYWLSLLFFQGFICYYGQRFGESEKVFEELLENASDEKTKATALFGMAFLTYERKEYLQTINLCEIITKNDPQFADLETVGFLVASSFHHLGRKDIFQQYLEQLRLKFPDGRYKKELERLAESQ
jgi:Tfp pilus assembly protein PilF